MVSSAPRHLPDHSIIHFFVILYHVFVRLRTILVNLLVLLIKLVIIGVSFVVQSVNGLFLGPVFRRIEVATALLLTAEVVLCVHTAAFSVVKVANIRSSGSSMLLHDGVGKVIELFFSLTNLVIKVIDLAVDAGHPMLIDIVTRIVVGVVQRTKLT